jgi:O-antigen ligase
MVVVSLPLLIFEAVYRFLNPINQERYIDAGREDIMFYIYKFNSVMYIDSNFVALYILSLLFFSFYINRYAPRTVSFFYVCILVFLLFSSISRAAIFSFLIFLFMLPFSSLIYKWRYYVMLFLPALLLFLFQIVFESSGFDDSLRSKFMILSLTVEYIKDIDPMTLLLGVGVGKAADVLGIGSHNIITTYLVELGLVGTSMISALWILIMIKSRYKAGIIMFPFLVCGLSLTTFAIPYLYAMFGIVYHIERDRLYE